MRDSLIRWYDPITLDELSHYVATDGNKFAAAPGKHDDLVMAAALALAMALEMHPGGLTPKSWTPPQEEGAYGSFEWWAQQADDEARWRELNGT
ncbi:MAG: hypothetical protein ACYTKD_29115 [Planctomycetota bacterium]